MPGRRSLPLPPPQPSTVHRPRLSATVHSTEKGAPSDVCRVGGETVADIAMRLGLAKRMLGRWLRRERVEAAERMLRGVLVGRKNHHGSRSRRGTEVAALYYTLLGTARLGGVDPRTCLREAAVRAITEP